MPVRTYGRAEGRRDLPSPSASSGLSTEVSGPGKGKLKVPSSVGCLSVSPSEAECSYHWGEEGGGELAMGPWTTPHQETEEEERASSSMSMSEEEEELPAGPAKPRRRPYTRQEQQMMVDYLVKRRAFALVGGDGLWKRMEAAGVCRRKCGVWRRSWRSLREQFRRRLVLRLHTFGLSSEQVDCCRAALRQDGPGAEGNEP
jgi:hypothetical protein